MKLKKILILFYFIAIVCFAEKVDIGVVSGTVFIEKFKDKKEQVITGNGKIHRYKYRKNINKSYKIILKDDTLLFPDDSSSFFEDFKSDIEINENIDTSNVTNMKAMFRSATYSNPNVSNWNVENVTTMESMFENAENANPDVSKWNTKNVTNMNDLFRNAKKADPDVSKWNTSKVTNMGGLFDNAIVARPNVSNWDTSNVKDMTNMFQSAKLANPDVSRWDTSKVTGLSGMFQYSNIANPDVSRWDTSNVTSMSRMFCGADKANPDVTNWDTSNVEYMDWMFYHAKSANPNVSKWDVSKVRNMERMFQYTYIANPDVSKWKTSSLVNMNGMFSDTLVANPDISNWDVSNVTNVMDLFDNAKKAIPVLCNLNFNYEGLGVFLTFFDLSKSDPEVKDYFRKNKPYIPLDFKITDKESLKEYINRFCNVSEVLIVHYKENDDKNRSIYIWEEGHEGKFYKASEKDAYGKVFIIPIYKGKENSTYGYLFANEDFSNKDCFGEENCGAIGVGDRFVNFSSEKEIWVEQNTKDKLESDEILNELKASAEETANQFKSLNEKQKEELIKNIKSKNTVSEIKEVIDKANKINEFMFELRKNKKALDHYIEDKADYAKEIEEDVKRINNSIENENLTEDQIIKLIKETKDLRTTSKIIEDLVKELNELKNINGTQKKYYRELMEQFFNPKGQLETAKLLDKEMKKLKDKINEFEEYINDYNMKDLKKQLQQFKNKTNDNIKIDEVKRIIDEINKLMIIPKIDLKKYTNLASAFYYTDRSIADKFNENSYFEIDFAKSLVDVLANKKDAADIIGGIRMGANYKVKKDLDLKLGGFFEYQNKASHNVSIGTSITYKEFLSFLRYRIAVKNTIVNHNVDLYARYQKAFDIDKVTLTPKTSIYLTYSSKVKLDKHVYLKGRAGILLDLALLTEYHFDDRLDINFEPKLAFGYNDQKLVQDNYKDNEYKIKRGYLEYQMKFGVKYRFINDIKLNADIKLYGDMNRNVKLGTNLGIAYSW